NRVYSVADDFSWRKIEFPFWLRYLHFHEIKGWIGLSTASLIAFVIGIGCVAGALLVGLLTARNFVDWQAIQFYRAEWLLAATASFVAGNLLEKPFKRKPHRSLLHCASRPSGPRCTPLLAHAIKMVYRPGSAT